MISPNASHITGSTRPTPCWSPSESPAGRQITGLNSPRTKAVPKLSETAMFPSLSGAVHDQRQPKDLDQTEHRERHHPDSPDRRADAQPYLCRIGARSDLRRRDNAVHSRVDEPVPAVDDLRLTCGASSVLNASALTGSRLFPGSLTENGMTSLSKTTDQSRYEQRLGAFLKQSLAMRTSPTATIAARSRLSTLQKIFSGRHVISSGSTVSAPRARRCPCPRASLSS